MGEVDRRDDDRCAAHDIWNCTACGWRPPGPTLAEMVEALRSSAVDGPTTSPIEREFRAGELVLAAAISEIDRRLTALEEGLHGLVGAVEGAGGPLLDVRPSRSRVRPPAAQARPRDRGGDRDRESTAGDRKAPAYVSLDLPCSTFVTLPGRDGCARCGFAEAVHHGR